MGRYSVPKLDVEAEAKSRGHGPVSTYQMSPEELEKYRNQLTTKPQGKRPVGAWQQSKPKEDETVSKEAKITKEDYLRLQAEGLTDEEIAKQHDLPSYYLRNYYKKKKWGLTPDPAHDVEQKPEAAEAIDGEVAKMRAEIKRLRDQLTQAVKSANDNSDVAVRNQEKWVKVKDEKNQLEQRNAELNQALVEADMALRSLKSEQSLLLATIETAAGAAVETTTTSDPVNRPAHYTAGGVECIDAIEAATTGLTGGLAYNTGAAIKYLWRWSRKNGAEDLQKARWYVDRLIEGVSECKS